MYHYPFLTTKSPRNTTSDDDNDNDDDNDYKDDTDLGCALGTPASALEYLLPWPGDVIILTLSRHCHHERLLNLKQKILTYVVIFSVL